MKKTCQPSSAAVAFFFTQKKGMLARCVTTYPEKHVRVLGCDFAAPCPKHGHHFVCSTEFFYN